MKSGMIALASVGVGAGIMYLADPRQGSGRRARVRDALVQAVRTVQGAAGTPSRDIENRAGRVASRTAMALQEPSVPLDDVLAARVRGRVGRLVSHPGAIEMRAASGVVTLSGPVFDAEAEQLVDAVRGVPGVREVHDHLERHPEFEHVPAFQGPGPLKRPAAQQGWLRWTPMMRVAAGATGLVLLALAARRRTIGGTAIGLAGFELVEQAVRSARTAA